MPTFNPVFFGHSSTDYIPANLPVEKASFDPNARDNILRPQMTEAQWHEIKPRWSFSASTGELESPYYMPEVDPREVNRILSVAWEKHGKEKVKVIVLWLSPECVDEQYTQLVHYKFERAGRETKIPQLCFVGPATPWRI
jgi:hypothetical protein